MEAVVLTIKLFYPKYSEVKARDCSGLESSDNSALAIKWQKANLNALVQ